MKRSWSCLMDTQPIKAIALKIGFKISMSTKVRSKIETPFTALFFTFQDIQQCHQIKFQSDLSQAVQRIDRRFYGKCR